MLWWWTGALPCMTRPAQQRLFHTFATDVNYITSFKYLQKFFLWLCWRQIQNNEIWKSWSGNLNKTVVRIRSGLFKMCWILPDSSPEIRILYTSGNYPAAVGWSGNAHAQFVPGQQRWRSKVVWSDDVVRPKGKCREVQGPPQSIHYTRRFTPV